MKKYLLLITFLLLTFNSFCANTLTNSTSGKLAFEDWAGQSQGSLATSTDYTFNYNGTQAYTWTVSGAGGKLAVVNSSAVRTWMYIGKTITSNSAILQASTLIKSGADGWFSTQNRGGTGGSSSGGGSNYDDNMPRLYQRYYGTGTFTFSNPIGQADTYPTQYFTWTYDIWYNTKYVYKDNKCLYAVYRDSNNQLLQELSNENYLLRSYGTGYRSFNPNDLANKTYLTNLLICSDNIATFTGLTPTARVNIFNAAETSLLYSNQVTATANNTTFEFGAKLFPVNSVIQIVGTDGSQLTKTAAVNIYGGDIWTYSGDFAAPIPTQTFTATITRTNTPVNTATFTMTSTKTLTVTNTATLTPTYTITPTYTATESLIGISAFPYTWTLKRPDGSGIGGKICWIATVNNVAATPYSKKKTTNGNGRITWNLFQKGTYYIFVDGSTMSVGNFTITDSTFAYSAKGSGVGLSSFIWQLKGSDGQGMENVNCWITSTNVYYSAPESARVKTDSGGYIVWRGTSGIRYWIWSELQDTYHATFVAP